MTALLLRGSATLNKGVSLRMSVPAGMVVEAKQPSPSPGEARTVYTLSISRLCRDGLWHYYWLFLNLWSAVRISIVSV